MKTKNRVFSLFLCVILLLGLLPAAAFAAEEGSLDNFTRTKEFREDLFTDVGPKDWFFGSVWTAYELGLMQGSGDRFDPSGKVTLAETVTVAARLHAIYYTGGERFASGSPWYQPYVDYALEKGILAKPFTDYGRAATRAEYATILAAALPAEALPAMNTVADDTIPDVKCSDACGPAVYTLYRAGVLTGSDKKGTFSPRSTIARSEVAAIVSRMASRSMRRMLILSAPDSPEAFCTYALKNEDGLCLVRGDGGVVLKDKPAYWSLSPAEGGGFHIKVNERKTLMLDISNAWYVDGNSVGLCEDTGYTAQHWNFERQPEGGYLIASAEDPNFVLTAGEKGIVISDRTRSGGTVWTLLRNEQKESLKFTGSRGIVTILLDNRVLEAVSAERLQQWADDLETAYDSFAELTGYADHKTVIIDGSGPVLDAWGCYSGENQIYLGWGDIQWDLEKMAARKNDWNFGTLHEMGHLFDNGHSGDFDGEVMTDLKVLYVIDQNNACAAPAEFPAEASFTGMDRMLEAYHALGGDLGDRASVYNIAAKFGEIAQEIGWEPFKETFRAFPDLSDASAGEKLATLLDLLTEHSGQDVRGLFTQREWENLSSKFPMN